MDVELEIDFDTTSTKKKRYEYDFDIRYIEAFVQYQLKNAGMILLIGDGVENTSDVLIRYIETSIYLRVQI